MQRLLRLFQSQIRYKIILPYLSLMLLVTLVGAAIALALTTASLQERLTEQLKQIGRSSSTALIQRERDHLAFLYLVALSQSNGETGALSMPDAFDSNDSSQVIKSIQPYYDYQRQFRDSLDVDRFIAFDRNGKAFFDYLLLAENQPPANITGTDLGSVPDVRRVLQSTAGAETDKYANLIQFLPDKQPYFYTAVPVTKNGTVVGGVLIGIKIDRLLNLFEKTSQSVVTNIYDNNGQAIGSSLLQRENELPNFSMSPQTVKRLTTDTQGTVFDTVSLQGRNYEFAYSPLVIAQSQVGYFSVALSSDFQAESLSLSRNAVLAIALALALGAVYVGYRIARSITQPLSELVQAAEAVSAGDLERRTTIASSDELGRLGIAFNQMTEHLLRLYNTSRDLSSKIDVDTVLDVTGATAQSLVEGTEVFALLDDRGSWAYVLPRDASAELRALEPVRLSTEDMLLNELARERTQRVFHASDPVLATSGLVSLAGFQHLLLTPLLIRESLIGVLIFGHRKPEALRPADLPTLSATANMASSVLYNALLYGQVAEEATERTAILRSIADGVVVVDETQTIVLANDAAQRMLGMSQAQLIRRSFADLPLEHAPAERDIFGEARVSIEHYRVGETIVTLSRANVLGEDGNQLGEVIVLHDISAEVAVDQAKTEFIEIISHELRTPLTPIYTYAELFQRGLYGPLNSEQREAIEVIFSRAEQMRSLISNIILVASIQSNSLATEVEPIDVAAAIEAAVMPMQRAIEKKQLHFEVDLPEQLPPMLADREQFRIILTQLLDNARRYTAAGSITIRAVQHEHAIQIDVCDTGMGIPPERLERLFTRFHRIEGNSSQERGGGLGLAIIRQLVERQDGHVWVKSEMSQGSTFSFSLPIADGHSNAVAEPTFKNSAA